MSGAIASNYGGHVLNIGVWTSLGYGFTGLVNRAYHQGGMWAGIKWSAGDYNGDGKTDILAVWARDDRNVLTVRRSDGWNFIPEHWRVSQGGWSDLTAWCSGKYH